MPASSKKAPEKPRPSPIEVRRAVLRQIRALAEMQSHLFSVLHFDDCYDPQAQVLLDRAVRTLNATGANRVLECALLHREKL